MAEKKKKDDQDAPSSGGEDKGFAFTTQAAKYLANALAYDDVIRVADLKVRESRFDRVRKEVGAKQDQLVYMTEYMHPRMEEVCGTLPAGLGLWIESSPRVLGILRRVRAMRRPGKSHRPTPLPGLGTGHRLLVCKLSIH